MIYVSAHKFYCEGFNVGIMVINVSDVISVEAGRKLIDFVGCKTFEVTANVTFWASIKGIVL